MGSDTTYLCVVDADGNCFIHQSNFASFGSGLAWPALVSSCKTGAGSSPSNRQPECAGRPQTAVAHHHSRLHEQGPSRELRLAIMGGWNQSQAHAQFVSDVVDYDMNIQAALEAPASRSQTFPGCDVEVERRVRAAVREALAKARASGAIARGLLRGGGRRAGGDRDFATGINYGASDPRKDGAAIPQGFNENLAGLSERRAALTEHTYIVVNPANGPWRGCAPSSGRRSAPRHSGRAHGVLVLAPLGQSRGDMAAPGGVWK